MEMNGLNVKLNVETAAAKRELEELNSLINSANSKAIELAENLQNLKLVIVSDTQD